MGLEPWPLLILGTPGTGKTSAALALCDYIEGSEFWTAAEFHQAVLDVKFGRREWKADGYPGSGAWTVRGWWGMVAARPLVVLDDLGTGEREARDAFYESIKTLLDKRTCRPLIVTSNLSLEGLEKVFDGRVADRLAAGTVIEVSGESMRG